MLGKATIELTQHDNAKKMAIKDSLEVQPSPDEF
jgi:hypothetical protein